MVRLLRGVVTLRGKDYLVVDVGGPQGGMGFKVYVTEPAGAQQQAGDMVTLHTYLQVREDALTLFGFATEDELQLFELLITVSGVGPRIALAALSVLSPDALRLAIASEEPALIARVPGIGKRTAQKIVLELKDKVQATGGVLEEFARAGDVDTEVIDALIALGYSVVESQRAVQALPKEATSLEERLRLALSRFAG